MSIPSWAVPGAKCVCLDGNGTHGCLTTGAIYTVEEVVTGLCLSLREAQTKHAGLGHWYIRRFRPLVDTTTDDEVEQRLFRKKRLHQPVSGRLTA
jgi:hypothetical protein